MGMFTQVGALTQMGVLTQIGALRQMGVLTQIGVLTLMGALTDKKNVTGVGWFLYEFYLFSPMLAAGGV